MVALSTLVHEYCDMINVDCHRLIEILETFYNEVREQPFDNIPESQRDRKQTEVEQFIDIMFITFIVAEK